MKYNKSISVVYCSITMTPNRRDKALPCLYIRKHTQNAYAYRNNNEPMSGMHYSKTNNANVIAIAAIHRRDKAMPPVHRRDKAMPPVHRRDKAMPCLYKQTKTITHKRTEIMEPTDKYHGKYRIAPTRLKTWDYRWDGYYFVTICTKNRKNYFGDISDGKMVLNEWGEIAKKYWQEIPAHFDNAKIDEFVVMPNHIHGIIILENANINSHANIKNNNDNDNDNNNVETRQCHRHTVETRQCLVSTHTNATTHIGKDRFQNQGSKSVSSIIGSYKSICTKTINRMGNISIFAWQSGFYDHIIRGEESLENIRNYIINNPGKWDEDENNISQLGKEHAC